MIEPLKDDEILTDAIFFKKINEIIEEVNSIKPFSEQVVKTLINASNTIVKMADEINKIKAILKQDKPFTLS